MNFYLNILLESAHAASIIPFSSQTTYFAMKAFGGYDMALPFVLAVMGATCGQLFNWWLGQLLLKLPIREKYKFSQERYDHIKHLFNHYYGLPLLFFSWSPLCNLFVFAAGFLGTRLTIALPIIIVGQIFNYGRAFF